jgi:hypothetical protein
MVFGEDIHCLEFTREICSLGDTSAESHACAGAYIYGARRVLAAVFVAC